jgi:hypothetical protein
VCEENLAAAAARRVKKPLPVGASMLHALIASPPLATVPGLRALFHGRRALAAALSPRGATDYAVAYGPCSVTAAAGQGATILPQYNAASLIAVYRAHELRALLACWGVPTCIAFSPADGGVLIAGTREAALAAWDLTEPAWLHPQAYGVGADGAAIAFSGGLRAPSFSTAAAAPASVGVHTASSAAPIVSVAPAVRQRAVFSSLSGGSRQATAQSLDKRQAVRGLRFGAGLRSWLDDDAAGGADASSGARRLDDAVGLGTAAASASFAALDECGEVSAWVLVRAADAARGASAGATGGGGGGSGSGVSASVAALIDDVDYGRGVTSAVKLVCVGRGQARGPSGGTPAHVGGSGASLTPRGGRELGVRRSRAASCFAVSPADPARFLVGASDGRLHAFSRLGERVLPSTYLPHNDFEDAAVMGDDSGHGESGAAAAHLPLASATCVAYSAADGGAHFVAGHSDGSVALYSASSALPLCAWPWPWREAAAAAAAGGDPAGGSPVAVAHVAWLPTRPASFVAVTRAGVVALWDLASSAAGPLHVSALRAPASGAGAAAAAPPLVSVSLTDAGPAAVAPARVSLLAAFADGSLVVYELDPALALPRTADRDAAAFARVMQAVR